MPRLEFGLDKKVGIAVALAAVAAGAALVLKIRREIAEQVYVPEVNYGIRDSLGPSGSSNSLRTEAEQVRHLISSGASSGFIGSELSRSPLGQRINSATQATFGSNPSSYQRGLISSLY